MDDKQVSNYKPEGGQGGADPGEDVNAQSDGRKLGHWQTRYSDPKARKAIRNEAIYLGIWFIIALIGIFILVCKIPQNGLNLSVEATRSCHITAGAWVAGLLGGATFSIKWLYRAVARNNWNEDRRLWRYFTPHISGALAVIFTIIISSGLFGFFDPDSVDNLAFVIGLSFLVGYFSDNAISKLAEIAESVFGKHK